MDGIGQKSEVGSLMSEDNIAQEQASTLRSLRLHSVPFAVKNGRYKMENG